jgi:hypothetical protein
VFFDSFSKNCNKIRRNINLILRIMRKFKLFSLCLFTGLMLLQSVPMHADPPPNWEFWVINEDGSVYHWNSSTNQYEWVSGTKPGRIIFHPVPW